MDEEDYDVEDLLWLWKQDKEKIAELERQLHEVQQDYLIEKTLNERVMEERYCLECQRRVWPLQ